MGVLLSIASAFFQTKELRTWLIFVRICQFKRTTWSTFEGEFKPRKAQHGGIGFRLPLLLAFIPFCSRPVKYNAKIHSRLLGLMFPVQLSRRWETNVYIDVLFDASLRYLLSFGMFGTSMLPMLLLKESQKAGLSVGSQDQVHRWHFGCKI